MTKKNIRPVTVLGSIFINRQKLIEPIEKLVLDGMDLTRQEADILIFLYGHETLGWEFFEQDKEGYVSYSELRRVLLHGNSMLSRRIGILRERELVDSTNIAGSSLRVQQGRKVHGRTVRIKITKKGVATIEPVWERYSKLAEVLIGDMKSSELSTCLDVLNQISVRIEEWTAGRGVLI